MKSRFLYMKLLGLLLVIVGFSFSLTSFNNFFSFVFKTRIFAENLNIYLMSIGLVIPLYLFIFGVYFYFYSDFNITKISKFLFISFLLLLIVSIFILIFKTFSPLKNVFIVQIFEFIHISLSPCVLLLSLMGLYGCFKYKY